VTTAEGTGSFENGVTITPITAGPTGTDTAPDAGTAFVATDEHPVRSLAKAISLAAPGDTVFLKAGDYNHANGDDFFAPGRPDSNVPAGLTVQGEAGTKLVGPAAVSCGTAGAAYGLVLAGDTHLEM